jgi:hypothetical protein
VARSHHFAESQSKKVKEGSCEKSRYAKFQCALELGPGS